MHDAIPHFHLFDAGSGARHVLIVEGSRVFDIDEETSLELTTAAAIGEDTVHRLLTTRGLRGAGIADPKPPVEAPIRALSLAVAQACNLGCTYCYAEGGSFGGAAGLMPQAVAEASVRRLLADVEPGGRVNLAFMGGEPLLNRALIHQTTHRAVALAAEKGVSIGFAITTNGTLLGAADADFFSKHRFSVTVSLDGIGPVHDHLRPTKRGAGSFDRIVANVSRLLNRPRAFQMSARVTVTPANLALRETLDHFVAMGFDSVGFSPLLAAPTGSGEMASSDLDRLLDGMIACGREFEHRTLSGRRYPFSNMLSALDEIHRGTHRPYPCGAGAGYMGVAAQGSLFACHRFVGDEAFQMGHVGGGVDRARQATWLAERRVDRQEPCRRCWARYLCGGGCHYEVIHRGRPACDFIRGWLDYALGAYIRLSAARPDLFDSRMDRASPLPEAIGSVA